jgi:hypothetical protein
MSLEDGGSASLDPPYEVYYEVLKGLPKKHLAITRCNLRLPASLVKSFFQYSYLDLTLHAGSKSDFQSSMLCSFISSQRGTLFCYAPYAAP